MLNLRRTAWRRRRDRPHELAGLSEKRRGRGVCIRGANLKNRPARPSTASRLFSHSRSVADKLRQPESGIGGGHACAAVAPTGSHERVDLVRRRVEQHDEASLAANQRGAHGVPPRPRSPASSIGLRSIFDMNSRQQRSGCIADVWAEIKNLEGGPAVGLVQNYPHVQVPSPNFIGQAVPADCKAGSLEFGHQCSIDAGCGCKWMQRLGGCGRPPVGGIGFMMVLMLGLSFELCCIAGEIGDDRCDAGDGAGERMVVVSSWCSSEPRGCQVSTVANWSAVRHPMVVASSGYVAVVRAIWVVDVNIFSI